MHIRKVTSSVGILLAALVPVSGCQNTMAGGIEVVNGHLPLVAQSTASQVMHQPRILKDEPANDGMAHARITMVIKDDTPAASHYGLLNVATGSSGTGATAWNPVTSGAMFTLNSGSRTQAYTGTVGAGGFSGAPLKTTALAIPPMRPANDYAAQIFLTDGAATPGKLWGSNVLTSQTLNAGATNNLVFTINPNMKELTIDVASSTNNNSVASNDIVNTDTVTLDTGIMASQDGVVAVNVYLWGACYTGAALQANRVFVGQQTTLASLNTYSWVTTATPGSLPANAVGGTPLFAPASIIPGTNLAVQAGNLDFEAVDVNKNIVGKSTLAIGMFGVPALTLQVQ